MQRILRGAFHQGHGGRTEREAGTGGSGAREINSAREKVTFIDVRSVGGDFLPVKMLGFSCRSGRLPDQREACEHCRRSVGKMAIDGLEDLLSHTIIRSLTLNKSLRCMKCIPPHPRF